MLSALGAPGLLVPEAAGGLGLSDVDLVGVLEEAGWAALPEPLLETAGLAAPMLATLLPAPSAAAALATLLTDGRAPCRRRYRCRRDGALLAHHGLRRRHAAHARGSSGHATPPSTSWPCRDPDSGWQLHAVPAEACAVHPTATLDQARDLSTVQWPLSADTLLAYGVAAEASVGLMADRGAAGSAAFLIGLADRMITLAADYAKERHQFGKPIGSFQAVKHLLADARVKLEFARPATYRAAWSLATAQPTVSHDASMAKALASDAADLAARVALQVHGAIGYTWECDLHFFMKRTWALSRAWGDAATHRQLVLAQARRGAALDPGNGDVRFPPVIGGRGVARCRRDRRSRTLLPSGAQQGRPLRRRLLHRRHLDRHLLSAQLPRPHPQARERALLRLGRRGPAGRLPRLPALPARRHPGLAGMEHAGRRGGPGHAAHPGRHRRPRRRGGAGPPPRLQRAPTEPRDHGRGRHRTAGHRPGPARPDGAHPPRDDRASRRPRGLRRRILQRPPVQRDGADRSSPTRPGDCGPA